MINVAVLISGAGSNLRALLERGQKDDAAYRIVCVGSNKINAPGLQIAEAFSVPTFAHVSGNSKEKFEQLVLRDLDRFQPALIVLAGFMRILSPDFLQHYAYNVLNIHPALLPKFPGAHALRDALSSGESETGASVHWVDDGVDTGRVLEQTRVPIFNNDNEDTLKARIQIAERALYPKVLQTQALKKIQQQYADTK